jgi:magnesium transporter
VLTAVCHSAEKGWTDVEDLSKVSDLRELPGNLLWAEADVTSLGDGDIEFITEEFGLEALAVEDALEARERPKLERFRNHTFLVLHQLDEVAGQLESRQIACFAGPRFALMLHDGAQRTLDEARRRWSGREFGVGELIHTLADVIVDDYQDIADRIENEMEEIEEIVLETPHLPIQRRLYRLKQRLARLRRYAVPASRLIDRALDSDSDARISEQTKRLFRDVHDHLLRITDQIRNLDELSQAVLTLTRSEQADALNETSKKLSAWAAIFAVGTVIAGVYGMNFQLVPKDNELFGFWFAIALMIASGGGLYLVFKSKKWL